MSPPAIFTIFFAPYPLSLPAPPSPNYTSTPQLFDLRSDTTSVTISIAPVLPDSACETIIILNSSSLFPPPTDINDTASRIRRSIHIRDRFHIDFLEHIFLRIFQPVYACEVFAIPVDDDLFPVFPPQQPVLFPAASRIPQ